MQMIFFFYGLAFIILATVIFVMPERRDYFGLKDHLWLIGLFGLVHGLNEWTNLFILRQTPFNVEILKIVRGLLLPVSFLFLAAFGASLFFKGSKGYRRITYTFFIIAVLWLSIFILSKNLALSEILARYFICLPAALLTASGLFMTLRKNRHKDIPSSVRAFMISAICAFIAYGILAGLITPRADFPPANFLNYNNFVAILFLPVQFFRMLSTFLLVLSFSGMVRLFVKQKGVIRGSIKRKMTIIICLSILSMLLIGALLVYIFGYRVLHNTIGRQYVQVSELLGAYVKDNIASEVEDVKSYTTRSLWKGLIAESNSRYGRMDPSAMEKKFLEMDKAWVSSAEDSPLLKEYLENRAGIGMRDLLKTRLNISEIFITDKYGAIVAASGKTSDFYQADETWWQEAYNNGKGKTYVGDIEFDESSSAWSIPIAVPVKDDEDRVIGICKDSINIYRLFHTSDLFKIGESGHAVITDIDGTIIYHKGLPRTATKILNKDKMAKLLSSKNKFFVSREGPTHDKNLFFAYSFIDPPYLSDRGVKWIIFIVQDQDEALEPLYVFISSFVIIALMLVIVTIPIGAFFGGMIAKPIHDLHVATEKISSGDWDYKIDIHTGDEIEQFSDTFRVMVDTIKDKQMKLQDFSHNLEEKVKDRTKELTETQEATLNILEDLEDAKKRLEISNKELRKLDQLKSDFISTVSHELRTPLSIIKEGVSLVLDKVPGGINEKQQKILDISKFNIDRLARIIDSLLDIAKIESGKVELKKNLINICDVARQVADSFDIKIKEKGLELKLDIDKDAGKVYADTDRITQVFVNLIGNAIKFTSSGCIEVSCKGKDNTVVCSVKDTGPGISKDDLPKLFNKFQQFGRLAGAGEKGTGLGLSIAKGIIDAHNGSITVESEPAKGSTLTFMLPKYTEKSLFGEFAGKAIKKASASGSKLSIIIISSKWKEDSTAEAESKNFHTALGDCVKLIKNTLRRQGDELINNNGDMMVILADCSKENSVLVRNRFEQILNNLLEEKKIKDKIDIKYGYATFPDDGNTDTELLCKASSNFCIDRSIKA